MLVIALTARDYKLIKPSGVLVASVMWVAGPVVAIVRFRWAGWPYDKILWVVFALFVWVVVCGLGRPALLLDKLFRDRTDVPQNILLRSFVGQLFLLAGLIALAVVAALA